MKSNIINGYLCPSLVAGLIIFTLSAGAQVATVKDSLGGAPVPPEIQDPEIIGIEYRIDLPESRATFFCINHQTLGVGTAGCGPRPLPQYIPYAAPSSFTYKLELLAGGN